MGDFIISVALNFSPISGTVLLVRVVYHKSQSMLFLFYLACLLSMVIYGD